MAPREGLETFIGRGAVGQIGLQHPLDGGRRVLRFSGAIDLAAERRIGAKSSARQDVIALDRGLALGGVDLGGEEADIADMVLSAGVMTAGEMDVQRAVELDP